MVGQLASAVPEGVCQSVDDEEDALGAGVLDVDARCPVVVDAPSFVMTSLNRPTGKYQCPERALTI